MQKSSKHSDDLSDIIQFKLNESKQFTRDQDFFNDCGPIAESKNIYSVHSLDNTSFLGDTLHSEAQSSKTDYEGEYQKFVNNRRFSVPPFLLHVLKKMKGKKLTNGTAEGMFLMKMFAALQKEGHMWSQEIVGLNDFLTEVAHGIHKELGRKQNNKANWTLQPNPEDTKQHFGFVPKKNIHMLRVRVSKHLFDQVIIPSFNVVRFEVESIGLRTRLFTASERKVKKLFGSFNIPTMKRCLTRIDFFSEKHLAMFPIKNRRDGRSDEIEIFEDISPWQQSLCDEEEFLDPYKLAPEQLIARTPLLHAESKQSLAFTMESATKTGKLCGHFQDPHFIPHTKIADDLALERWQTDHLSVKSFVHVEIDEDHPFEVYFNWPNRKMPNSSVVEMEFVWRFNGFERDIETGMTQPIFRQMR